MVLFKERKESKIPSTTTIPRHVAIIMDGNGRWAKNKGKLCISGHKAGINSVKRAINFSIRKNLNVLTLYAFSSENWNRSHQEVSNLMNLFLHTLSNEIENLHKYNIKFHTIGDISKFSLSLQKLIKFSENLTSKNNGLILNIAVNYGGRWDIVQGVKKIALQVKNGVLCPSQINENVLRKVMCMHELAPVDLVIRTGGEYRISNFLLWQIAYSELFFTNVLWPDFNENIFEIAIKDFAKRKRRFGKSNKDSISSIHSYEK